MDYGEKQTRPNSIQRLLIHQVEEQSEICDVTIKVDNWEKKFHRCVLIQSPFFECVFRHEYKETLTGKIEINLGTPATVKMAILFLYGKKPKLTLDNADIMMMLAEYFFIPNLKSNCVAWLQAVEVNEDNCTKLIEIASLFDINLYECMEFAKGRLDILIGKEGFTRIDSDSVKYIFTEPGLSYISMDEKLNFLVKWTQVDSINRLGSAKDLVKILDFHENSHEMLKRVVNDPIFRDITEGKVTAEIAEDEDSRHEVLIMDRSRIGKSFWCLDLTRNKWFKLDRSTFSECPLYSQFRILGVQNSESTVYFLKGTNSEHKIVLLDLESFSFKTFPVVQIDGYDTSKEKGNEVRMYLDVCLIKDSRSVPINKKIKVGNTTLGGQRKLGLKSELCYEERVVTEQIYINTSTVHIGKVVNDQIETKPLFTFLHGDLSKMCINNLCSVAFIDEKRRLIVLYDINDCKMEIIKESTIHAHDVEICCAENGFVIFNNTRCIYLLRQENLGLETKYQKTIFWFSDHTSSNVKLYFLNDRWYRYFQNRYEDKYEFAWAAHGDMLAAKNKKTVHWTPLPLPLDAKCRSDTLNKKIFYIRLQKSKLMCDIECPHCDRQKNGKPVPKSFSLYQSNIRNYHGTRNNYGHFSYDGSNGYSDKEDNCYYYDYSDNDENVNDWFD